MLEVKGLHAGYGGIEVVRGVDFTVGSSEVVSVIGPNGAGKSTILKSVFSLADVTAGKIIFDGEDVAGRRTHELIKLGIVYVPQGKVNFGTMTVLENLVVGADDRLSGEELNEKLEVVYERFPVLGERKNELAYRLSGGQQQMLALGRALMRDPRLLLLDEPSLGLSPRLRGMVFETITQLRRDGVSICLVEQNAKKAVEVSDRTYLLENQRLELLSARDRGDEGKLKVIYLGG